MAVPTQDLVFSRTFNAPVELVWQAWTDSELVRKWWGPDHFSCPSASMDVRVGGTSIIAMLFPEAWGGQTTFSAWHYSVVDPLHLLEYRLHATDEAGVRPDGIPLSDQSGGKLHRVEFKALEDSKTELAVTEYGWTPGQMMEYSRIGMEQCLTKMETALAHLSSQ